MYELFVLGQLMDQPMSGYLMRHILQQMVGRQRQISFGMIYPLFDRLAKADYITLREVVQPGKRAKKVATITQPGRQRFYDLMAEPVVVNPNTDFTFSVKFRNFHQVDRELRVTILRAYQAYLTANQTYIDQRAAQLPTTNITASDLHDALRVMALDRAKTLAALAWTHQTLEEELHDNI